MKLDFEIPKITPVVELDSTKLDYISKIDEGLLLIHQTLLLLQEKKDKTIFQSNKSSIDYLIESGAQKINVDESENDIYTVKLNSLPSIKNYFKKRDEIASKQLLELDEIIANMNSLNKSYSKLATKLITVKPLVSVKPEYDKISAFIKMGQNMYKTASIIKPNNVGFDMLGFGNSEFTDPEEIEQFAYKHQDEFEDFNLFMAKSPVQNLLPLVAAIYVASKSREEVTKSRYYGSVVCAAKTSKDLINN